jgi:hypothetical protein
MTLVIDCHGHYTVLPKGHDSWREAQKAAFKAGEAAPPYPEISDDEIRETIESNQLRLISRDERQDQIGLIHGIDKAVASNHARIGVACAHGWAVMAAIGLDVEDMGRRCPIAGHRKGASCFAEADEADPALHVADRSVQERGGTNRITVLSIRFYKF